MQLCLFLEFLVGMSRSDIQKQYRSNIVPNQILEREKRIIQSNLLACTLPQMLNKTVRDML